VRREFYFQDETSNKFWTIELTGSTCVTTNGRVGAKPRETRKDFPDAASAQRDFDRQIAAKVAKGYVEGSRADIPKHNATDWSKLTMSDDVFWRIIKLFDWKKTGDDDAVLRRAVAALSQMTEEDICRFEDILASKLFLLDTEAHAREIGSEAYHPDKHFSVDWFLYERCVVIANGRELFDNVLADPRNMPKDMEFEAILTLAGSAFELKTGRSFEYVAQPSYETFSNAAGWPARAKPG
jgi:predicted DNA-binding WGR domain protein